MDSFQPPPEEGRLEPGVTIANYVIEELLGQGTQGSVYVARDSLLGRQVALKTLRASEAGETRGVEEARLLASLEHPHIVRVYHARRHQGVWYVVSEYLAGGSLDALLERLGSIPLEQALDMAGQAAQGLAYAHERGILHRDVKPHNLLLSRRGEVKLADFGLALDVRGDRRAQSLLVGTPAFLAPEIWQGGAATTASDVWSLGACLFLLLAGRLPFAGNTKEQIKQAHAELAPKFPPGLPPPVAALLKDMLAKDAALRPSSRELPRLLSELAQAPYRAPAQGRAKERRDVMLPPFAGGGPERAARQALLEGRDAACVAELAFALESAGRGVELCAAHPADALLLLEVALEAGGRRSICARLSLNRSRIRLHELIERQLELREGGTLNEAGRALFEPARRAGNGGVLVVQAPRGLTDEQRAEILQLTELAADAGVVCVVVLPLPDDGDVRPGPEPLIGFKRLCPFESSHELRDVEERLEVWLRLATDGRLTFSRDGLRLAAYYCQREKRFWAGLGLQSLLIACAASLPVITSWAVAGAREQGATLFELNDVPSQWRRKPRAWPTPSMARELAGLRREATKLDGARALAPPSEPPSPLAV